MSGDSQEPKQWWEEPSTHKFIYLLLIAICGVLFCLDLLMAKKTHFNFEGYIGFFGIFGALAYTTIVVVAKGLRKLISRAEDYYDN